MSDFERWKGILERQANSDGPLDYKHKVLEGIADLEAQLAAERERYTAKKLAEHIANWDFNENGDYFGFKFGGDGDNGEVLIAALEYALQATAQEKTK